MNYAQGNEVSDWADINITSWAEATEFDYPWLRPKMEDIIVFQHEGYLIIRML